MVASTDVPALTGPEARRCWEPAYGARSPQAGGDADALGGQTFLRLHPVVRGHLYHGRLRVHAAASRRNLLPWNTSGAMAGSACSPRISSSTITWSPAGTRFPGVQERAHDCRLLVGEVTGIRLVLAHDQLNPSACQPDIGTTRRSRHRAMTNYGKLTNRPLTRHPAPCAGPPPLRRRGEPGVHAAPRDPLHPGPVHRATEPPIVDVGRADSPCPTRRTRPNHAPGG